MADPIISKICTTCKKAKPSVEFFRHKGTRDGYAAQCKECHKEYYKTDNGRKVLQKYRGTHLKNKREVYRKTKNDPGKKEGRRRMAIKTKYGITDSEYLARLNLQNGLCAICGNTPNGKLLVIDHCHKTGMVRGLLCSKCNTGMGLLGDNIANLLKAVVYLNN